MKVIFKKWFVFLMILSVLFGMVPVVRAEGEAVDLNSIIPDVIDVNMVDPNLNSYSAADLLLNDYLLVDYINDLKEKSGGDKVTFEFNSYPTDYYKGKFVVRNYGESCPDTGCVTFTSKEVQINYAKGTEANIKKVNEIVSYLKKYWYYKAYDMGYLKININPELIIEEIKSRISTDFLKYTEVKTRGCVNSWLNSTCNVDVIVKIDNIYYNGFKKNYGWEKFMYVPEGTKESDYENALLKRLKEEFPNDTISVTKNKTLLEYVDNDKDICQSIINEFMGTYIINESSMIYDIKFNDKIYPVFIVPSNREMNYNLDDIIKNTEIKLPSVPLNKIPVYINDINDYLYFLSLLYLEQYENDNYYLRLPNDIYKNSNDNSWYTDVDLYVWDWCASENYYYKKYKLVESKKFKVSFAGVYDENVSAKLEDAMEKMRQSKAFIINDLNYLDFHLERDITFKEHTYADEFNKLNLDEKIDVKYIGRGGYSLLFFGPETKDSYLLGYDGIYYKHFKYSDGGKGFSEHKILFVPEGTDKKDYAGVLEYRVKQKYPDAKVSVMELHKTMQEYITETGNYFYDDVQGVIDDLKKYGYEENLTLYEVTVDDFKEIVLISANKDTVLKSISTKDEESGVVIESNEVNIPDDAKVEVKIVDRNNPELKDVQEIIKNDNIRAYDISLNSESEGQITKTKAGKFQVTIPLGKESVGKHYVAYFIDSEGKIQRHAVKIDKEGNATFKTNHFSRYIISEEEFIAGDLNYNKQVDLTDVLLMLKIYFNSVDVDEYTEYVADINENNGVDLTDVLILLKNYFKQN